MSRESMLVLAGGAVIIACVVSYYDSRYPAVKGIANGTPAAAAPKHSAPDEKDNPGQINNDNNTIDQMAPAVGKSTQAAKTGPQKPQIKPEQFVVFDAWPTASNNCANKPAELLAQDANQEQQSKNGDQNSLSVMTPQSVLDDEFKSTSDLYKGLANRLEKQGLNITEYNVRIRRLQGEYDEKIKALFRKWQKLDATQKLINNGSVTPEEGRMIMWRLVLPDETIRALSSNPKAPVKQPPVSPPAYGTVTGIMYSNETPSALIDGEIYSEGVTVHGVRIAKILRDSIEFECKGLTWSQNVNDPPSPNWP